MTTLLDVLRRSPVGRRLAALPLRPRYWLDSYRAARHLWQTYGHARSVRASAAVDAQGQPIPWYTYPAIEYLAQIDFSGSRVFEYGSGHSTLFWARVAAQVVSVEDDEAWYGQMQRRVPANCMLLYEPDLRRYVDVIDQFDPFDVIVVDGPARGRTRLRCARAAVARLRPGGLVILDNSDWLPESARLLREADLLQVDMSGFVPIAGHTQTTTLFFHRECRLTARSGRQPHPSRAAVHKDWETDAPSHASPGETVEWDGQRIRGVVARRLLRKQTPDGARDFEVAIRELESSRAAFIYDRSTQRILVGPYLPADPRTGADEEVARLSQMPWQAFCSFVRNEETRRYLLD